MTSEPVLQFYAVQMVVQFHHLSQVSLVLQHSPICPSLTSFEQRPSMVVPELMVIGMYQESLKAQRQLSQDGEPSRRPFTGSPSCDRFTSHSKGAVVNINYKKRCVL